MKSRAASKLYSMTPAPAAGTPQLHSYKQNGRSDSSQDQTDEDDDVRELVLGLRGAREEVRKEGRDSRGLKHIITATRNEGGTDRQKWGGADREKGGGVDREKEGRADREKGGGTEGEKESGVDREKGGEWERKWEALGSAGRSGSAEIHEGIKEGGGVEGNGERRSGGRDGTGMSRERDSSQQSVKLEAPKGNHSFNHDGDLSSHDQSNSLNLEMFERSLGVEDHQDSGSHSPVEPPQLGHGDYRTLNTSPGNVQPTRGELWSNPGGGRREHRVLELPSEQDSSKSEERQREGSPAPRDTDPKRTENIKYGEKGLSSRLEQNVSNEGRLPPIPPRHELGRASPLRDLERAPLPLDPDPALQLSPDLVRASRLPKAVGGLPEDGERCGSDTERLNEDDSENPRMNEDLKPQRFSAVGGSDGKGGTAASAVTRKRDLFGKELGTRLSLDRNGNEDEENKDEEGDDDHDEDDDADDRVTIGVSLQKRPSDELEGKHHQDVSARYNARSQNDVSQSRGLPPRRLQEHSNTNEQNSPQAAKAHSNGISHHPGVNGVESRLTDQGPNSDGGFGNGHAGTKVPDRDSTRVSVPDADGKKNGSAKRSSSIWNCFSNGNKRGKHQVVTKRLVKAFQYEYNTLYNYSDNYISTSKYNVITFLPKNLFEQFQRIANAYFLVLLILQLIPQISSLTFITTALPLCLVLTLTAMKDLIDDILIPQISSLNVLTTILPLVAVLLVTAVKDALEDLQRHRSDNQVNNRLSFVLRDKQLVEERWQKLVVGDVIKMVNNQPVAADLLLLSTSEPNGLCYVETAELDGETNLKVKQALPETADMDDDLKEVAGFNGEVECEPPNNNLEQFKGVLKYEGKTYSLDKDKVLLRGCVVRNTKWCFALVLFAGRDTKLMMNSGLSKFKRTHIDRLMNLLIIGIFMFLVILCIICAIAAGIWESTTGRYFQIYLPWDSYVPGSIQNGDASSAKIDSGGAVIALLMFFSYVIVLNTLVPISLYVSWWINWDTEMYCPLKDTPSRARTTTLNEELGQIEYIFSDKTGTLTQNIMTFNKCSINGKHYGDPVDADGNNYDVTEKTPKVDFSENKMSEPKFVFYDVRLWEQVKYGNQDIHAFFRLLALCHTVMPEDKKGQLYYQAQSPDEAALVGAARNFGFVFRSRTPNSITIEVLGRQEVHELLCVLDFDNVRKRMSVILRKDGVITLYCKGADTTVYEKLRAGSSDLQELTTGHLNDFAREGLRTLCCAVRTLDAKLYESWKTRHHVANTSLNDREAQLSAVYEEIETDLSLVGVSAIEDKLQEGVPEAIANLALADIKIWVLTGDKQETAVNIGYSCHLLTEEMEEIFIVDSNTPDGVRRQLMNAQDEMRKKAAAGPDPDRGLFAKQNGAAAPPQQRWATDKNKKVETSAEYAIVVNGHSLTHALQESMEQLLLETASSCKAVICCRVSPLQKSQVVELVKKYKKTVTLAIGDGANDVSMIKAAHIGIGISGQEGMQAVLASDFSMAQFRFLERLLLVHGRWSYLRMSTFLRYFFYKNFAFTLCHFWFAFFCGFSAQTLFDPYFISLYNVCYTSLPVLVMGIFDQTIFDEAFISLYNLCYTSLPVLVLALFEQDVNDKYSHLFPKLYAPGQRNMLFNKTWFAISVAEGFITSLTLFFIPYFAFRDAVQADGTEIADHQAFGYVVASTLIIVVTIRCGLEMSFWTPLNHFVVWGSIAFYFVFILIFYLPALHYTYAGTATTVLATADFWFTLILTSIVLLLPVVARKFYLREMRPTLTDRVRMKQRQSKTAVKPQDRIIRHRSTMRGQNGAPSLMRVRRMSSFAFAQQPGIGEMIATSSRTQLRPGSSRRIRTPAPHQGPGTIVEDDDRLRVSTTTLDGAAPVANISSDIDDDVFNVHHEPHSHETELPSDSNKDNNIPEKECEITAEPAGITPVLTDSGRESGKDCERINSSEHQGQPGNKPDKRVIDEEDDGEEEEDPRSDEENLELAEERRVSAGISLECEVSPRLRSPVARSTRILNRAPRDGKKTGDIELA